jgi:MoxR-like ATPase
MSSDLDRQQKCVSHFNDVRAALHKNIVGMDSTIDALFWTLLCGGHSLFVGVPGLAKTLLISSLSELIGLHFNRVQFTPDMMPNDLIGGEILEEDRTTGKRSFEFRKGPLFCQLLLADEINRTSPKTQSALLQAMQEKRISFAGKTYDLSPPFVVFATQNPIESEGTYPLPEAQLDRFLFSIPIHYPTKDEEKEIVRRTTSSEVLPLKSIMTAQDLMEYQQLVKKIPIDENLIDRSVSMVRRTRPEEQMNPSWSDMIRFGAGPRASQALVLGAKARALLSGRFAVRGEDIEMVAPFVLEHRLVLRKMRSQSAREILNQVLAGA